MKVTSRRAALALLGSTLLSACAAPGLVTRDDRKDPFEGGIGGTGIVGILTDFGSLVVNGLRVELTASTEFASAYGPSDADALAPGMALTILASRTPDTLVARRVAIEYALVGPARLGPGGTLTVNGAIVRPEPGVLGTFAIGTRVAVSGAWSAQGLIASRVDPAPHSLDLVAGTASHGGATGLAISGVPVRAHGTAPREGEYAVAIGRHHADGFAAEQIRRGRLNDAEALRQLSVEGYLEPVPSDPGFRIAGLGHSFSPALRLQPLASHRAIYFGPYDGLFEASAGYVVPEDFPGRRSLLGEGYAQGFGGPVVPTR